MRGPCLSPETLLLLTSLLIGLFANRMFWSAALAGRSWADSTTWLFALGVLAVIASLHFILLGLIAPRRLLRSVLALVVVASVAAMHYMQQYTVYFDTQMMRNVLHTEPKEAAELLSVALLAGVILWSLPPLLLLWWVRIRSRSMRQGVVRRMLALNAALLVCVTAAGVIFPDLSALMRNQKELRFLVTPANLMVSAVRVAFGDAVSVSQSRVAVGEDAHRVLPSTARPRLLVLVVGETVRAQNWGLNGYQRQTTPRLAELDVVNFSDVSACGTSTEVSLPCMFSAVGRRDYSESRIRQQQSLLHVLDHAGVATLWIDNQTGSKHVADGLAEVRIAGDSDPELCDGSICLDGVLLGHLKDRLATSSGDGLIVLHQLGNHGPAYSRRYPPEFQRFVPVCHTAELGSCRTEEIVNAYDNAVLYTDHLLAQVIGQLRANQTHDVAMIYLSDHGESLGEHGLFLHGVPYAIAPAQQIRVPMLVWLSSGLQASTGIDANCLAGKSSQALSHDYLFHSVLGLLGVETSVYDVSLDLFATCHQGAARVASDANPALLQQPGTVGL